MPYDDNQDGKLILACDSSLESLQIFIESKGVKLKNDLKKPEDIFLLSMPPQHTKEYKMWEQAESELQKAVIIKTGK